MDHTYMNANVCVRARAWGSSGAGGLALGADIIYIVI